MRFDAHLDDYVAGLAGRCETKTIAQMRAAVEKFGQAFTYTADVTQEAVQQWVIAREAAGWKAATITRALVTLRPYWRHLVMAKAPPREAKPFDGLVIQHEGKAARASKRQAFTPKEIIALLAEARQLPRNAQLADLIEMARWTGGRIEEICSLPVGKVDLEAAMIDIEDAKSPAGWRTVPIHPELLSTMQWLIGVRTTGYVLAGLNADQNGDRSKAIGDRFSRMKKAMGFGKTHVFHSIRHSVACMFRDAGVPEPRRRSWGINSKRCPMACTAIRE